MDFERQSTILITCSPGLGGCLARETEALGFPLLGGSGDRGVVTRGTLADTMVLNLRLRTAFNVLYRISRFPCPHPEALYGKVRSLPWERFVPPGEEITVTTRVRTPSVDNTMFPALKVKDGVVDRLAAARGGRPDSGREKRGVVIHLTWVGREATLHLNTSGRKISDRGYRRIPGRAPLRENLAAGILLTAGYTGREPLANPMCGSGTLAIEAALIAAGRAPGLLRDDYGVMHLADFPRERWEELRRRLRREPPPGGIAPIVASDIDPAAVAGAERNARTAGVEELIRFETADFADTTLPGDPGLVILNPAYGERLEGEKGEELAALYRRIGDFFKQRCAGWRGFLFTGNRELAKSVGLRTRRRHIFFNGRIECRLLEYELYPGSRKP